MPNSPQTIGFGATNSSIRIYIANRPQLDHYPKLQNLQPMAKGEITHIAANTSNHWRKAFNVYAKFLFDWHFLQGRKNLPNTWQEYREQELFQAHSQEALFLVSLISKSSRRHFTSSQEKPTQQI